MINLFSKPVEHKWKLLSKMYAQPVKVSGKGEEYSDAVLLGITTLVWECQLTGDVRTQEVLGSDESQVEELCDKVLKQGSQNFKNLEGKIFTISVYSPPVIDPQNLPLR